MALTVFNNQCCEVENQGMCSLIMLTSCKVMKTVWLCLCCLSLQLSQLFPDECLEKLLPQMPGLDSTHELDPRYFYFWILTQTENKFSIKSILGLGYSLNIYNIHFKFSCKNTELYIESLFAKNDKRHLRKKRADFYALFCAYSAIWTLNMFCHKSRYCPLPRHREFMFYCRSRQAPLLFFNRSQ